MSDLTIVCDNCGAKYRLPASFSGDKAKCKQCGSAIDVAAQKTAAAAPAKTPAQKPAVAAAPAATRSSRSSSTDADKPGRSTRAGKGADESRGRRGKKDADGESGSSRGERPVKKNNAMLFVGGGIGALALVAVIVALGSGKKNAAQATDQAKIEQSKAADKTAEAKTQPLVETPPPVNPVAATPAVADAAKAPAAADAKAPPAPDGKATEAPTAPKPAEASANGKTDKTPAESPTGGAPQRNSDRNKTASMEAVFDPKTLGEVTWPSDVTAEQKTEIRGLMQDILDQGRASIVAKPKVVKFGYTAIFGIVEQLRQLDYRSTDGHMTAFELNKLLQEICAGMNTGFEAVNIGDTLKPNVADWNAQTNRAWAQLLLKFPSKDAFETWKRDRLEKGLDKK